ncbi:hypothetical protein [Methylobacterium radiotolerans]
MKPEDVYIHRQKPDFVVRITDLRGDDVAFAPEGGGFVRSAPRKLFESDFRAETPEDRSKRLAYSKDAVQLEWADPEAKIPAWLNGRYWNGWAMPPFEKDDLLQAVSSGLLSDVEFYEPADMFVSIMQTDGSQAMPTIDREQLFPELARQAAAGERLIEMPIGGVDVTIELYPGEDLPTADGSTVHAYPVGAGSWCWEQYRAPEPSSTYTTEPASIPTA